MTPLAPFVATACGAASARRGQRIQSLWQGWGEIVRYHLDGGPAPSVIVKRVRPPRGARGRSAARKRRSYTVEAAFYRHHAPHSAARVPALIHASAGLLILEDLDAAGFPGRGVAGTADAAACVDWLADFHAGFLGRQPEEVWSTGSYWHLSTRPDELAAMPAGPLKDAAAEIAARLRARQPHTLLHGDAKVANFCFGAPGAVAAVDFQYTGAGCGVVDLAYLLGSALSDAALHTHAEALTARYFARMRARGADVEPHWRPALPMAWADFERFLAGWAPGSRRGRYAEAQVQAALAAL